MPIAELLPGFAARISSSISDSISGVGEGKARSTDFCGFGSICGEIGP